MFQHLMNSTSFFLLLFNIDKEIAMQAMSECCQYCGGKLHIANYERKPRGLFVSLARELCMRFSFCCANDGCRKRHTPPSLRFLGPKVYAGFVVLLASALKQGLTPDNEEALLEFIPKQTLYRWLKWWQTEFGTSAVWKELKAYFNRAELLPKDWLAAITADSLSAKLKHALHHASTFCSMWALNVTEVVGTQKL